MGRKSEKYFGEIDEYFVTEHEFSHVDGFHVCKNIILSFQLYCIKSYSVFVNKNSNIYYLDILSVFLNTMNKLRFSGHDTFIVRSYWPKKGYDFIKNGYKFSSEDAVVELGVGKNMVTSIQFWMKALGLLNDDNTTLTNFAKFLFEEQGGVDVLTALRP